MSGCIMKSFYYHLASLYDAGGGWNNRHLGQKHSYIISGGNGELQTSTSTHKA